MALSPTPSKPEQSHLTPLVDVQDTLKRHIFAVTNERPLFMHNDKSTQSERAATLAQPITESPTKTAQVVKTAIATEFLSTEISDVLLGTFGLPADAIITASRNYNDLHQYQNDKKALAEQLAKPDQNNQVKSLIKTYTERIQIVEANAKLTDPNVRRAHGLVAMVKCTGKKTHDSDDYGQVTNALETINNTREAILMMNLVTATALKASELIDDPDHLQQCFIHDVLDGRDGFTNTKLQMQGGNGDILLAPEGGVKRNKVAYKYSMPDDNNNIFESRVNQISKDAKTAAQAIELGLAAQYSPADILAAELKNIHISNPEIGTMMDPIQTVIAGVKALHKEVQSQSNPPSLNGNLEAAVRTATPESKFTWDNFITIAEDTTQSLSEKYRKLAEMANKLPNSDGVKVSIQAVMAEIDKQIQFTAPNSRPTGYFKGEDAHKYAEDAARQVATGTAKSGLVVKSVDQIKSEIPQALPSLPETVAEGDLQNLTVNARPLSNFESKMAISYTSNSRVVDTNSFSFGKAPRPNYTKLKEDIKSGRTTINALVVEKTQAITSNELDPIVAKANENAANVEAQAEAPLANLRRVALVKQEDIIYAMKNLPAPIKTECDARLDLMPAKIQAALAETAPVFPKTLSGIANTSWP